MSAARQRLKDKDFIFFYDDISKELYDQRKQPHMNIYPLKRNTSLPTIAFLYCTLELFFTAL